MSENGDLSLQNMTKVFLAFQTNQEWKNVITESINTCFMQMKSILRVYNSFRALFHWKLNSQIFQELRAFLAKLKTTCF